MRFGAWLHAHPAGEAVDLNAAAAEGLKVMAELLWPDAPAR